MPGTEPTVPSDWLSRGDLDFEAAEILLTQAGPLSMVAFHIQQAIEKYLKGFLIHSGWRLRRLHDLEVLIQQAIARDVDFVPFLVPCQTITEYYIETRYPVGYHRRCSSFRPKYAPIVTESEQCPRPNGFRKPVGSR